MNAKTDKNSPESFDVASLVDLERYPIDKPNSAQCQEIIAHGHRELVENGALALEGFLSEAGLERLRAEASVLVSRAQFTSKRENPYGSTADVNVPEGHPYRITGLSERHHVAYHMMPETGLDAFYRWPPLRQLVADLMAKPKLFLHEDPSNALVLMVYKAGNHLAWHFDRAQYSNIIELQSGEAGGVFEYVPRLRTADDECFADVAAVLKGERSRVVQSGQRPGAFTMIKGNTTLHRVTDVEGERPRLSLVLSYEEEPGVKLDYETRKFFFGDDVPRHPRD